MFFPLQLYAWQWQGGIVKFTRAIQLGNTREESDGNKGLSLGKPYLSANFQRNQVTWLGQVKTWLDKSRYLPKVVLGEFSDGESPGCKDGWVTWADSGLSPSECWKRYAQGCPQGYRWLV